MCEFVSWIEHDGELFYLDNDKLDTKDGRALVKYLKDNNSLKDMCGHGAIRRYYPELKGRGSDREVVDFSSPDNFPPEIAKKIKQGKMSEVIFENIPLGLLNDLGVKEYQKIEQQALAEYQKIEQPAFWEIFKDKKYRNKNWR